MVKFREFESKSGKKILCGKDAKSNEELVSQTNEHEMLFHTKLPGSPFCKIEGNFELVTNEEKKEVGIICARYSQDWRDNKKSVLVHYFLKKHTYKLKSMDLGTFGVKSTKEIKIKREEIKELLAREENEKTTRN